MIHFLSQNYIPLLVGYSSIAIITVICIHLVYGGNYLQKIRDIDFLGCFKLVPLALTIPAFLVALNYFSIQPELTIVDVWRTPPNREIEYIHNEKDFIAFYKKFGVNIPPEILRDTKLNKILLLSGNLNDSIDELYGPENVFIQHLIENKRNFDDKGTNSLLLFRTENLERQLYKFTFFKHVYGGFLNNRKIIPKKNIEVITKILKSKLSTFDYYFFLNALIYSRNIPNDFWVKNTGNTKIRNLKITLFPPKSAITQKRTGNILELNLNTDLPHEIIESDEKIILKVPYLEIDQVLNLQVLTKENVISAKDFYYTFTEDRSINKTFYLILSFIIFGILILLSLNHKRIKEKDFENFEGQVCS